MSNTNIPESAYQSVTLKQYGYKLYNVVLNIILLGSFKMGGWSPVLNVDPNYI